MFNDGHGRFRRQGTIRRVPRWLSGRVASLCRQQRFNSECLSVPPLFDIRFDSLGRLFC